MWWLPWLLLVLQWVWAVLAVKCCLAWWLVSWRSLGLGSWGSSLGLVVLAAQGLPALQHLAAAACC